ncbi:MAG: ferrochelatase [Bacteroidetes bacterium]|nr:ferrochelatase [Bacteroidota bacterium]
MSRFAVVLFNLGGPDSLEAIEPFLKNLFSDKNIFKIPFVQKFAANIIAKRRAPIVQGEYKMIGGKSPIGYWTEIQRSKLEESLRKIYNSIDVFTCMRYWHPMTEEVAPKVSAGNYDKILLLPLYPQYSKTTTFSSFQEWKRIYKGDKSKLIYINEFYKNEIYIKAVNERIDQALSRMSPENRNKTQLVFSAHGTPLSLVKKGDPYSQQIKETVELVMKNRKNSNAYHLCYQSKVGPVKWLEPSTETMIKSLAEQGKKHMLIIPISFVSDHVETHYELDIEYREIAHNANVEYYSVIKGLNDLDTFVESLKSLTVDAINK